MQHIQTLMVEDSRLDARILQGLMAKSTAFEFHVENAVSGKEARAYVGTHEVELMLLDLGLPDSSGADTLTNLEEIMSEVPVIVLTGDDDTELALTALRKGAQDYLVKGKIDLPSLEKSVQYALERHRLRKERDTSYLSLQESIERSTRMLEALDKTNYQLEQEIQRSRLLGAAIEQSVETVVITNIEGNIVYANESFETVTGYTVDEAIGKNPRILKSGLHDVAFYQQFWKALVEKGTWSGRIKNRRKDGTIFEEDARISSVKDEHGKVVNYVAVKRDITHEAALEMQLIQARKLESIGQLAAGIAHEINTPSQYVGDNIRFLQEATNGFISVLEKYEQLVDQICPDLKKSELFSALEQCKNDVDLGFLLEEAPCAISQSLDGISRISKIVLAMKEFSHPGTEQMTIGDVNKALNSTITVASNEWKYVAEVQTDLEEGLPMVPCFVGELNQVFLNIIVNAAHAIAESGREKGLIGVRTRTESPFVRIDISDNGAGIPESIRDKIFDPFFTTKEVGKGTGQGLALAFASVTERHNGRIQVSSSVGEGTTFSIFIPLTQPDSMTVDGGVNYDD